MTRPDPIDNEIKAATARRKGVKPVNEGTDPKAGERRRRIEEIAEERRIKEATEWLTSL